VLAAGIIINAGNHRSDWNPDKDKSDSSGLRLILNSI